MTPSNNLIALCWASMPSNYVVQSQDEMKGMLEVMDMYWNFNYMSEISELLKNVKKINPAIAQSRFDAMMYMTMANDINEVFALMQPFVSAGKFDKRDFMEVCQCIHYISDDIRPDCKVILHKFGYRDVTLPKIVYDLFFGLPYFIIKPRKINGTKLFYLEAIPSLFRVGMFLNNKSQEL